MECLSNTPPVTEATQSRGVQAGDPSSTPSGGNAAPVRIIVFDFATKQTESCVILLSLSLMITEDVLVQCFADCFVPE